MLESTKNFQSICRLSLTIPGDASGRSGRGRRLRNERRRSQEGGAEANAVTMHVDSFPEVSHSPVFPTTGCQSRFRSSSWRDAKPSYSAVLRPGHMGSSVAKTKMHLQHCSQSRAINMGAEFSAECHGLRVVEEYPDTMLNECKNAAQKQTVSTGGKTVAATGFSPLLAYA